MRTVELKQMDELTRLLIDLGAHTYLQNLVQYDRDVQVISEPELDIYRDTADGHLFDRQLEILVGLKDLLHSIDLAESIDENTE